MSDFLFIIGMHRSGTSALSGSTRILGATHAHASHGANDNNVKGHFEPIEIVVANDQLLETFYRTWNDCRALPEFEAEQRREYEGTFAGILKQEFEAGKLITVKDPRISLLPDLWADSARRNEDAPCFAIALRDPLASASSIIRRDGLTPEAALAIWLRYMLEAEHSTRQERRAFVLAEHFVTDPVTTLTSLAKQLKLNWPQSPASKRAELEQFIESGLLHAPLELDVPILSSAQAAFTALKALAKDANDEQAMASLDLIRQDFAQASKQIHNRMVLDQLKKAILNKWQVDDLMKQKRNSSEDLEMALARAYSYPWKPLVDAIKYQTLTGLAKLITPISQNTANRMKRSAKKRDPQRFSSRSEG